MRDGCSASEQSVVRTLERLACRFSAKQPVVDYGFILQRLDTPVDGRNWVAAATVTVPWKAEGVLEFQAAIDAIRARVPIIS